MTDDGGNIKVICRFRPFNKREFELGEGDKCVPLFIDDTTLSIDQNKDKEKEHVERTRYTFDRIYDMNST
jgi:hypothetical protein